MSFGSILFADAGIGPGAGEMPEPAFFADLHLDLVVTAIVAGREEYCLQPYFHAPLADVATIRHRHDVFQDLEQRPLLACIRAFAERMRQMRERLATAGKLYYELQKQRWFVDAVAGYCEAVRQLASDLAAAQPRSAGLLALLDYLGAYLVSPQFTTLLADTAEVRDALASIRYGLHIEDSRIHVGRYAGEPDYTDEVARTFAKFAQGAPKDYRFVLHAQAEMNHVEAAVLDRVALLQPGAFALLRRYCGEHRSYLDETLGRFDREVQFYLAYLEHIGNLKARGLSFCYPEVTDRSREIYGRDVFDLALAGKLVAERVPVVTNDFRLQDPERVVVVSGPNQGGKTTFARTFGQMHHLARIGCPVPGRAARLFVCDRLFTLFEREEHLENLSGKLEDELLRLHAILEQASSRSILIMNETLSSTTLQDALSLGRRVLRQIIERGLLCVYVTFLEELASLGPSTVSMVSMVDPADPALRTFKLVKQPADGLAYAAAIARKYRLTYESVKERIRS